MGAEVHDLSRQIFELDDDRVRIFCRPQFNRPPILVGRPPLKPNGPGICCRPGGGVNPTPASTSTTKFDTETFPPDEYEIYTGIGEGSYTGEDDYNSEYSLRDTAKVQVGKRRKTSTTVAPLAVKDAKLRMTEGVSGRNNTKARAMKGTGATKMPPLRVTPSDARVKRPIRSLRRRDEVVSFEDWKRKHAIDRNLY